MADGRRRGRRGGEAVEPAAVVGDVADAVLVGMVELVLGTTQLLALLLRRVHETVA